RVSTGNTDHLVEGYMARQRLHRTINLMVNHYHTALSVVANTDLVATVPERVVRNATSIRILQLPFELPVAEVRQFWHGRFHYDPANIWLRSQIADVYLDESK